MNNAARTALSTGTWNRVGITKARENALEDAMDTVNTPPATTKLVFHLRRH